MKINRFQDNPLIEPDTNRDWMSVGVFNAGVIREKENGLFKMLFRATGHSTTSFSSLGLAFSVNGVKWYVVDKPVLRCGYNDLCSRGIEDPRIVKFLDSYYIFATACSGAGGRIGIWRTQNFFEYEWIGSPLDWEDKDAAVVPEIIDGWVYLLHRRYPNIWLSRTKDPTLKSGWQDHRILLEPEPNEDKIGIAGPPVKTEFGWLVVIHAKTKYGNYHLRFITLENSLALKYVHPQPILSPEKNYELVGNVNRVVFSCATVDVGDSYYIYWGGGDRCMAGGRLFKQDLEANTR